MNMLKIKTECVRWIKEYFEKNGPGCKAVIGISGGKDSSVVASLCAEALGKERVLGILMPQHKQDDIEYAFELAEFLGIPHRVVNIGHTADALKMALQETGELSDDAVLNIPPRIRMAVLYAAAQTAGGRVACCSNLSERYAGYSTKFGDSAGDFAPIFNLTVREVKETGRLCGLPEKLISKAPSDGLCGRTDEERLGFTYEELDSYILEGIRPSEESFRKIERLHAINSHKLYQIPRFSCEEMNPRLERLFSFQLQNNQQL